MQELAKKHLQLHANFSLDQTLKLWEQSYVEAALKLTHGNLSQAAKLLGVNRTTLYSRMQTYSNLEVIPVMYLAHFGLSQPPFKITAHTEFFYGGGNRGAILDALIYAIRQGEGIIKVSGEVGSGKTMLCRMLQERLPAEVETVYLANPSVSPDEILHAIAFEMQLSLPREASRLEVMQALQDYLLERHAQGKQVVVFVEEAQGMPLATLEEIRLLSNLETQHYKLLQIVLFGQPELDRNLSSPEIRQLKERITHSFALKPLTAAEIRDYLMFRLRAADYHGPDLFGPAVIKLIARASKGLTRRVNIIADKTLLAAFAENTHTLTAKHVRAAIEDSDFELPTGFVPWPKMAAAAALLVLGTAVGAGSARFSSGVSPPSRWHCQSRQRRFRLPRARPLAPNEAAQSPQPKAIRGRHGGAAPGCNGKLAGNPESGNQQYPADGVE